MYRMWEKCQLGLFCLAGGNTLDFAQHLVLDIVCLLEKSAPVLL